MPPPRCLKILTASGLIGMFLLFGQTAHAAGTATFQVTVDTSPLMGHPAGPFSILVSFTDGSGLGDGNNTVTITNVDLGGGSALGSPILFGGASGTLETGVTVTDTSFLSFFTETFAAGSRLRFRLAVTTTDDESPAAEDESHIPDRFTISLLDGAGIPIPTLAPAADFFVGGDLTSSDGPPEVHRSDTSRPAFTGDPIDIDVPVIISDTTPPVIVPHVAGTQGNNGWYTSSVTVTWDVSDPETGITSTSGCTTTVLTTDTAGETLTCSATNGVGLSSSARVVVKIDKTAPDILGLPSNCSLWPPNHKLVQVATVTASDALSGLASFSVAGTSNEAQDPGPDIVINGSDLGARVVQLRAERLGAGAGRLYTLTATAADAAGNTATATATCIVPHDQGQ